MRDAITMPQWRSVDMLNRTSAHKLLTEEGRYRGIDRNLRLCQYCNITVVEDEYFLLFCPL